MMSTKCKAIYTLIMNIPIALAISLTAQLLATHTVVFPLLLLNFAIAYVISYLVGMFIPVVKWGMGFAGACKPKTGQSSVRIMYQCNREPCICSSELSLTYIFQRNYSWSCANNRIRYGCRYNVPSNLYCWIYCIVFMEQTS